MDLAEISQFNKKRSELNQQLKESDSFFKVFSSETISV